MDSTTPDDTLSPARFIRELWAIAPPEWIAEFNLLQYRPTQEDPGAQRMRARFWTVAQVLKEWDAIAQELDGYNRTQVENIHHAVNPRFRQPRKHGTNADVSHYVAAWIDVDFDANEDGVRKQFAEIVADFRKLGLGPSIIVESGRGFHAYWLFDRPYTVAEARPVSAGLQDYFKIADAVSDPRRILRMPGFINLKNPKDPKRCRVVEATWERFPIDRFKDFRVEIKQTEEEKEEERTRQETFTISRDPEIERIKEGPIGEGERHISATKLVGHYVGKLRAKKQVLYVVHDWNDKRCSPPLPREELERIVDDLWTKEQVKRAEEPKRERKEKPERPHLPWLDEDGNFNPAVMAAFLVKEYKFLSTPIGRDGRGVQLYIYRDGAFRPDGFSFVRREAQRLLGTAARSTRVTEVVDLLTEYVKRPYDEVDSRARSLINVKNGMLDWRSGQLVPHDPGYSSLIQIPVAWNADAQSEVLDKFFGSVLEPDAIELVEEFAGYLLIPDTSYAKCLVLVGEGGNGKSTFLKLLEFLVGKENISYCSLHSIAEDKFTAAGLIGKLANFYDELESRALENTGIFKQIVGGDPIKAEEKNKAPFSFRPFCRMVFATNQMPRATDRSQAYFDRFLFAEFNRRVRETATEILDYGKVLAETPGALEAFLARAIAGLRRLEARRRFAPSTSSISALEEYRRDCNSAYDFLKECCRTDDPNGWIAGQTLYDRYKAWSSDEGRKAMSFREFNRTVRGIENVREVRHGHGRGWGGLAWTNGQPPRTTGDEVTEFGSGEGKQKNLDF